MCLHVTASAELFDVVPNIPVQPGLLSVYKRHWNVGVQGSDPVDHWVLGPTDLGLQCFGGYFATEMTHILQLNDTQFCFLQI